MGWEVYIILIAYSYQSLTTKLTLHLKQTLAEMDKHREESFYHLLCTQSGNVLYEIALGEVYS